MQNESTIYPIDARGVIAQYIRDQFTEARLVILGGTVNDVTKVTAAPSTLALSMGQITPSGNNAYPFVVDYGIACFIDSADLDKKEYHSALLAQKVANYIYGNSFRICSNYQPASNVEVARQEILDNNGLPSGKTFYSVTWSHLFYFPTNI